jgi:RimJ/RimL family protein N-acetyltransferase
VKESVVVSILMNPEQEHTSADIERRGALKRLKHTPFSDATTGIGIVPFTGTEEQFDHVVRWELDRGVRRYLYTYDKVITRKNIRDIYSVNLTSDEAADFFIQTPDTRLIGAVSLEDMSFDWKKTDFGIVIGEKESWGKGLGSSVTTLVFARLKEFGFTAVRASVHMDNEASKKIFNKFPVTVEKFPGYRKWIIMTIHLDTWIPPETLQLVV